MREDAWAAPGGRDGLIDAVMRLAGRLTAHPTAGSLGRMPSERPWSGDDLAAASRFATDLIAVMSADVETLMDAGGSTRLHVGGEA